MDQTLHNVYLCRLKFDMPCFLSLSELISKIWCCKFSFEYVGMLEQICWDFSVLDLGTGNVKILDVLVFRYR